MKTNHKTVSRSLVVAVVILLVGLFTLSVAQAAPLFQDERPPVDGDGGGDGGGGGSGGGNGNGGGGGGSDQLTCASLDGQVLNWGFGPEPNVTVELSTGSWHVASTSASDGRYGFGGLGVGVAKLRLLLPPEQQSQLQPWVQEAAVYLNCDFHTVANLAVFSGSGVEPPATIEMFAPATLTADSRIPLRLTVKNDLPTDISNVIVTDLMPPGLVALDVQAASAEPQNMKIVGAGDDGQLVVVHLNNMSSGTEANIFVTIAAAADVPDGAQISNTATLFYRESIADQTRIDFTVGQGAGVAPSQITAPAPEAEASPTAEAAAMATSQPEPTPTPLPATVPGEEGEAFVPPPENVPTTGENLIPPGLLPTTGEDALVPPALLPETGFGLILPLGAAGLVGLAVLARLLRASTRSKE
jgi:uncharacterized repeat protein (TIGR01451 family)